MKVTIKDIAKISGFSVSTVSLVLNNKAAHISSDTKKIIIDVAKKTNYRPNQQAISLVKKKSDNIGLIIPDVSNSFFALLAKSVEDSCRARGWNLILCNTNEEHQRDVDYINVLIDKRMDGILYCMALDSDKKKSFESIQILKDSKIPFVLIDRIPDNCNCCAVTVDHLRGSYYATKHLLELGHKKIGCISGPFNLKDSKDRLFGYKMALTEYNINYDRELIFEGRFDNESGKLAIEYFKNKGITAIFAFNDMSALGFYKNIQSENIKIPDDISLVGYDNIFVTELLDTPITTVKQPIYELGSEAINQLTLLINNKDNIAKSIFLEPELIIRKSTKSIEN